MIRSRALRATDVLQSPRTLKQHKLLQHVMLRQTATDQMKICAQATDSTWKGRVLAVMYMLITLFKANVLKKLTQKRTNWQWRPDWSCQRRQLIEPWQRLRFLVKNGSVFDLIRTKRSCKDTLVYIGLQTEVSECQGSGCHARYQCKRVFQYPP